MSAKRAKDAQLIAVLAARGNGKSAWLAQWMAANPCKRRAIWDTKREHGVKGTTSLGEAIRWMQAPSWEFAYFPDLSDPKRLAQEFSLFCLACYTAKHCQAILEEMAFVTKPNGGPPGWRTLVMLGRDENPQGGNVTVVATAQRPASVDKDLLGNATLIHAGRLPYEADAVLVGRALGVPAQTLMQLPKLHWIERDEAADKPTTGVLSFAGKTAAAQVPKGKPPKGKKLEISQDR